MANLTKRAQQYYVEAAPGTSLYQIRVKSGSLPNKLRGRYTSKRLAFIDLNEYLFNGEPMLAEHTNGESRDK